MLKQKLKITLAALSLVAASFIHQAPAQSLEKEIKISVLAPEGSTWVKVMREFDKELQTNTGGKVGFKIYAGGVTGDEKDVIRKMKIGQVHAAGLTGVGLGQIVPSVRVLELPLLFRSYSEVDHVRNKLNNEFAQLFDQKGYVLLGWSEAGFVNILSNKAIKSKADMQGTKWWAWEGDPLVKTMYEALGVVPTPLALPDVLTSLQTKLIDAVYAPPVAALALQWSSKTKFVTELNLANSTGALIINKTDFAKLAADQQKVLKDLAVKYSAKLTQSIRAENTRSLEALKKNLQAVQVSAQDRAEIEKAAMSVWPKMVGRLYSQDLLNRVQSYIKEVRK